MSRTVKNTLSYAVLLIPLFLVLKWRYLFSFYLYRLFLQALPRSFFCLPNFLTPFRGFGGTSLRILIEYGNFYACDWDLVRQLADCFLNRRHNPLRPSAIRADLFYQAPVLLGLKFSGRSRIFFAKKIVDKHPPNICFNASNGSIERKNTDGSSGV